MRLTANVKSLRVASITTTAVCAGVAWLTAEGLLPRDSPVTFFALLALISGVIVVAAFDSALLLGSWRWVAVSPLALAALVWTATFVLRPVELYISPQDTIGPLLLLGFSLSDLTRTTAIVALGCATWSFGYLISLTLIRMRAPSRLPKLSFPVSWVGSAAALAVGVFLTGALFVRQGGPSALIQNPGSLHLSQGSSFYGLFGIWVLQGTALYALAGTLQGGRTARRVLSISAPLALLSPLALESRGLIVLGLLGALVVYLRFRTPVRKTVAILVTLSAVLAIGLEFSGVVRTYAQGTDLWTATTRAAHTPLAVQQVGDLSVFDDFLAMQKLIPHSIGWLDGRSLAEIPAALAPRAVWPGKPLSLDVQVTKYLYPGATTGVPIAMQGEFFWNFGLIGVAVGGLLLGGILGASMYLFFAGGSFALLAYAVVLGSTFALLTRALGTMTANTVIALAGVGFAYLVQPGHVQAAASRARRALKRPRRLDDPRPKMVG